MEYNVEEPQAYARLAYLLEKLDPDPRETLRLMQIAVQKIPTIRILDVGLERAMQPKV